jgi:hypothetical protein
LKVSRSSALRRGLSVGAGPRASRRGPALSRSPRQPPCVLRSSRSVRLRGPVWPRAPSAVAPAALLGEVPGVYGLLLVRASDAVARGLPAPPVPRSLPVPGAVERGCVAVPAARTGLRADGLPARTGARSELVGRGCLAVNLARINSHKKAPVRSRSFSLFLSLSEGRTDA